MSLVLPDVVVNAMADALDVLVNGGGGAGYLEFQIAAGTEVATCTFDATAFGAAAAGIITMASPPKTDSSAAGNAGPVTKFKIYDNASQELVEGTVTLVGSGGDIELTSVIIAATEQVDLTALTITVPKS